MENTHVSYHLEESESAICDSVPSSSSNPSSGTSTPIADTSTNASPFAEMLHSYIQRDDLSAVLNLQSNMYTVFANFSICYLLIYCLATYQMAS